MKGLLLLPVFLFLFVKANAQNRWMHIFTSNDSSKYFIDTLASDIKTIPNYNRHSDVVLIWIKTVNVEPSKKNSLFDSSVAHYAIDIANGRLK